MDDGNGNNLYQSYAGSFTDSVDDECIFYDRHYEPMVPSMALTSALPKMQDRGAFMSISSSLQQIAGGIAAAVGGMIVVQKNKFSPLEHYNTLGYVIVALSFITIFMVYRVSRLIKPQPAIKQVIQKRNRF